MADGGRGAGADRPNTDAPSADRPSAGVDRRVRIYEVGPRDGLQNEAAPIPTAAKARFVELLVAAGLREIEATSFVSPRAIPQLADADVLLPALRQADRTCATPSSSRTCAGWPGRRPPEPTRWQSSPRPRTPSPSTTSG